MIDTALDFVRMELDSYLLLRTGTDAVKGKLTGVVDEAGKIAIPEQTIGITLINVEEERTLKTQTPEYTQRNGQSVVLEPELRVNLIVMLALHFKRYEQALKYLSFVLTFFQSHPTFTLDEYPRLDPRISKLNPELLSMSYEHLNQIWAFIGGKQLPSVFYRLRAVTLRDDMPVKIQPPIQIFDSRLHSA